MEEIVWGDPPIIERSIGNARGGGAVQRAVEQLKRNPGRWAAVRVNTSPSSAATWRKLGCEVTTRKTKATAGRPNRVDVWARWPAAE